MYLLSHRYEAFVKFKRFVTEVETRLERKVKTRRTDRGREYLSYMFKEFCVEKGEYLPISYWADALLTTTYLLNRVPSKSIPLTPYELWFKRKLSLDNLRPWGLAGYVHNPTHKHDKLGPKATKMVFIRYPEDSLGYVIFGEHPNGGMTEIDSRNVNFLEDELPSIGAIQKDLNLYELQQLSLGEGG